MAKRELYDLSDEEFAYFLNEVGRSLNEENIPYIFVGGTAIQLQILKRLCNEHGTDISTLSKDKRLQDYIRSTDDIDLALSSEVYAKRNEIEYASAINKILDSLQKELISPSEDHILDYKLIRRGVKRPVFQVSMDGATSDEQLIALNISRKPEDLKNLESNLYQVFVNEGEKITIPYNSRFSLDVKAISTTNLLATKVSHFRGKDTMDIVNLAGLMELNNEELELDKIRELLQRSYSGNFNRFLSLINKEQD